MTAATNQPARRLRRTASWLLAMSLPVGVVAGAAAAHATGPDFKLVDQAVATPFSGARAIVVDGSGVVYVAETGAHVVKRIVPGSATPEVVAGVEAAPASPDPLADKRLDTPAGLALSPDGKTLYVADPGKDVVVKVDTTVTGPAPRTLTVVAGKAGFEGPPSNAPGVDSLLRDPTGLATDATGNLYIADSGNNQVEKLTPAGALTVFAGNGRADVAQTGPALTSPLREPSAVTVDPAGNVLIADAGNRTVDKVDPASGRLTVVGSTGPTGSPTALATDLSGTVYVADPTVSSLKKLTGGTVSTVTLGAPVGPVTAVATTLGGTLWLADATQVAPYESSADKDAPRITSAPPTTAAVGKPFSFQFTATGVPTPQWSFVDAKGPDGLSLGAATGVLSGTPTKAGPVTFTVRATNSRAHFDQVVTLTVGTLPAAPTAPTAAAGDGRAVVSWKAATAPTATTGSTAADVTGYVLTPFKDGVAQTPVEFTAAQATTQVVTGLTNGAKYTFALAAKNAFGTGTASAASTAVTPYATVKKPVLDVPLSRLSGKDRLETAVNSSKASFPTAGSAGAVVVSAAYKYADALAGARLASATSAPLLLTESDKLTAAVGTEITRVLAPGGTIYVLGGSGTVSAATETALTALSANFTVKRLAGDDRYETAAKIADEVAAQAPGTATAPVYLASGVNFPDGLAVSALAARTGGTVLLTDGNVLPAATKAHLQARDPGATRVVPVGGAAAAAAASLPAAGGSAARAIVGVDRFDTAALVARKFTGDPAATKVVGVATGDNWPDALVGSAAVGLLGGPLLLTSGPDLGSSAQSALGALNAAKPLTTGVVFGGEPSVPAAAYATFGRSIAQD